VVGGQLHIVWSSGTSRRRGVNQATPLQPKKTHYNIAHTLENKLSVSGVCMCVWVGVSWHTVVTSALASALADCGPDDQQFLLLPGIPATQLQLE